jgi:hypothetical protein
MDDSASKYAAIEHHEQNHSAHTGFVAGNDRSLPEKLESHSTMQKLNTDQ